ncbi:major royal jelly protein 1 [Diachasma alloeum]|uniref:major royal jelly protein 1 n=1 Tax=Diachasma alloeum TaxID=454923 RepID=UPI0007382698|nr:major royal jelly protein 1 [Diachasma alloeum]
MRGTLSVSFCLLSLVSTVFAGCKKVPLQELRVPLSGTNLEWPCNSTKNIYVSSGRYIPRNVIVTRMQMYKDEAIVALPRLKPGVPFTLGVVSLHKKGNCKIAPFPCWAIQEEGNCEALQSVIDIVLDVQDVLWVLDSGIVNTLTQPIKRCSPKVVAIDVKSGRVVKVVNIEPFMTDESHLQNLIVDYAPDGNVFLYISDPPTRTIIAYNVIAERGARLSLPRAVSLGSNQRDLMCMCLARKSDFTPVVYFSYMNCSRVFSIKAEFLRRGTISNNVVDVGSKPGKFVGLGGDNGSNLFFRRKGESDIYMWNAETNFRPENCILVEKGDEYRMPTQVVPGYKKLMWTLESNFQDYIQDTVPCSGTSVLIRPIVKQCE